MYADEEKCKHVRKHSPITETPVIRTATIKILGKNKQTLQMFDWNKLPLLGTLTNEDTNSRSLQCQLKLSESWL